MHGHCLPLGWRQRLNRILVAIALLTAVVGCSTDAYVITGSVSDENGAPAANVLVGWLKHGDCNPVWFQRWIPNTFRTIMSEGTSFALTRTDDHGEFRFELSKDEALGRSRLDNTYFYGCNQVVVLQDEGADDGMGVALTEDHWFEPKTFEHWDAGGHAIYGFTMYNAQQVRNWVVDTQANSLSLPW
jgi:hypothetical protein